jgi:hypothetical protein
MEPSLKKRIDIVVEVFGRWLETSYRAWH